jgi:hypothetical protein
MAPALLKHPPPSPEKDSSKQRFKKPLISQNVIQASTETQQETRDDTPADTKRVRRSEWRQYQAVKNSIGSYEEETGDAALDAHYNMYIPKTLKDATWIRYEPESLPSSFARARRAGCLLPDPLQNSTYYTIGTCSHMARRLNIWTVICNRFVWLGYPHELLSLRLVDYQLYLIASHAMRRRSRVCFVEPRLRYPEPITEDTVVGLGRTRILPPLPKSPSPHPFATYQLGEKLQFIPRESTGGRTVLTFQILQHLDVGPQRTVQRLYGKIVDAESFLESTAVEPKVWEYLVLKGREMEAHVYDPLYINIEHFPPRYNPDNKNKWPVQEYHCSRPESSRARFNMTVIPMQHLCEITPDNQTSPLVNRPYVCRLFHPSRELIAERACAVVLVQPLTGIPISRFMESPNSIAPKIVTSNIINAYQAMLARQVRVSDFIGSVLIQEDGSVCLCKWKNTHVESVTPDELAEWQEYCDKLVEKLKVRLAQIESR